LVRAGVESGVKDVWVHCLGYVVDDRRLCVWELGMDIYYFVGEGDGGGVDEVGCFVGVMTYNELEVWIVGALENEFAWEGGDEVSVNCGGESERSVG